MPTFTRGYVVVSQSKDKVFDVLAESCNEVKARIENSDKDNYQITGKSPKFQIILKDYESGAMIDVYMIFLKTLLIVVSYSPCLGL